MNEDERGIIDNDEPEYEPGHHHHQVDWDRLHRLRQAHAIESEDLVEWYAQKDDPQKDDPHE